MSDISTKLTYLDTTKQLLKTEINKINNVLTDESTFRSYPQELFNGYLDILNNGTDTLWNNLEKVSQTGTEAVLEGVETAPMKIELSGNTIQDGTPTPDTPVDIQVVTGENVVSVSGKNLLDISYLVEANADKTYVSQGFWAFKLSDKIGTYTLSRENANMVSGGSYIAWGEGNDITTAYNRKTWIAHQSQPTLNNKKQIKTNSGELWLFLSTNETKIQNIPNDYGYLMLEEGSTATDFVPYSKTDYPINLVSKNLFSTENLVNATLTDTGEYLTGDNRCTGDYVFLDKSQENLALSFNLNILFMGIAFYNENKQYLSRATINNTNLLTAPIPTNAEYCRPFFQFTTSPAAKIDAKIVQQLGTQLEYGTERTNYVSYFTPIELCKINTYKDYFHKDNGKWYVHKEINKIVLNGSENWSERTNAINVKQFFVGNTIPAVKNITQYCNYFAKYSQTLYNYGGIGDFAILTNSRQFFGCVNSDLTLENFKTLLASNNLIVYYVLATPTETEITNTTLIEQLEAISKAKSVKDKTYITQTNEELPFILDVEAIKEYEVV